MNPGRTSEPRAAFSSSLVYITIAVVSASGLLFEFIQTRILSYIFWNHIVYLTISVALLGFGISGTVATILARKRTDMWRTMPRLCAGMSASLLFSLCFVSLLLPLLIDESAAVKLMACYLVSVVPFIFAGAIISLLFAGSDRPTGRLYRTDLLSAAAGSLLFFFVLPLAGAVPAIAGLAALLALLAIKWGTRRERLLPAALAIAAIVLAAVAAVRPAAIDFRPEGYKEMGGMLQAGATIDRTRWTTISRIDVVSGSREQLLNYTEHPSGSYKIITQDGSAHTRLVGKVAIDDLDEKIRLGKPVHPSIIPYSILDHPDVAIIGTGGGIDVAHALGNHARSVFGIELNPWTYHLTKDVYADWNGRLMSDPRVAAINAEGRSAIRSSSKKFDLIQVIAIDTFAALNSGAYVLSENYLYTTQAFHDYFGHLKPNGMLSMYRWNSNPPKETLRLVALAAQAWREQGITHIDDRIMVVGNANWALTIFKNGPFTVAEADRLASEAAKTNDVVLYWPNLRPAPEQRAFEAAYARTHLVMSGAAAYRELVAAYENGNQQQFFASYPYKITPTTDNSPFFFETSSLTDVRNWNFDSLRGSGVQNTLLQITLMATLIMIGAIVLPLGIFHRRGLQVRGARPYTVYFFALGLGFMTLEIGLMQKSVLILGNPMYSVPVLLTSILLSAGAGSGFSSHWETSFGRKVCLSCGALLIATAFAGAVLNFGAAWILPLSMAARAALAALCVAPVGFVLGIFFPTGLQALRTQAPEFVPWAWGINGCASVYGSVLAIVLAMWRGFNFVLYSGVGIYALAALAALLVPKFIPSSEDESETADEPQLAVAVAE